MYACPLCSGVHPAHRLCPSAERPLQSRSGWILSFHVPHKQTEPFRDRAGLHPGPVSRAVPVGRFVDLIPETDVSGAFYSGRHAFNSPSRLYLLGPQPASPSRSIRMNGVLSGPEDWSAWRDMGSQAAGAQLSATPRPASHGADRDGRRGPCRASEVVFSRSTDPNKLDMDTLARLCWPFHEAVTSAWSCALADGLDDTSSARRPQTGRRVRGDEPPSMEEPDPRERGRLAVVTLAQQADWTARRLRSYGAGEAEYIPHLTSPNISAMIHSCSTGRHSPSTMRYPPGTYGPHAANCLFL